VGGGDSSVEPNKFGPFLRDVRKQKDMTQPQLAEALHVSPAAVSKWERGKCLPDVAKFEELARLLDISVLELMQCELSEEILPRKDIALVYTETLAVTKKETRRKMKKIIWPLLCAGTAAILLFFFPIYRIALVWYPSYFDTGEISVLAYIGSSEDRKKAESIMKLAEKAFSDITSTDDETEKQYGELSRYSIPSDRYTDVVEESHDLRLWSARFNLNDGLLWVWYTQEGIDAEGNTVTGNWNIPSLWYLERNDEGIWEVKYIKEHP